MINLNEIGIIFLLVAVTVVIIRLYLPLSIAFGLFTLYYIWKKSLKNLDDEYTDNKPKNKPRRPYSNR